MRTADLPYRDVTSAQPVGRAFVLTLDCGHTIRRLHTARRSHCEECAGIVRPPKPAKAPRPAFQPNEYQAHADYLRLEGMLADLGTQNEVARRLGVTRQSVSSRLLKGRRRAAKMAALACGETFSHAAE